MTVIELIAKLRPFGDDCEVVIHDTNEGTTKSIYGTNQPKYETEEPVGFDAEKRQVIIHTEY